jgi:hypothetical protein
MNPDPQFARLVLHAMMAEDPKGEFASPDGREYQVEVDPAPGIRRRIRPVEGEYGGIELINWAPALQRPDGFPAESPFLPDVPILTMKRLGAPPMEMTWFRFNSSPNEAAARLLAEGQAVGWEEVPLTSELQSILKRARLQNRGPLSRLIFEPPVSGQGTAVLVLDMPASQ